MEQKLEFWSQLAMAVCKSLGFPHELPSLEWLEKVGKEGNSSNCANSQTPNGWVPWTNSCSNPENGSAIWVLTDDDVSWFCCCNDLQHFLRSLLRTFWALLCSLEWMMVVLLEAHEFLHYFHLIHADGSWRMEARDSHNSGHKTLHDPRVVIAIQKSAATHLLHSKVLEKKDEHTVLRHVMILIDLIGVSSQSCNTIPPSCISSSRFNCI